MKKKQAIAPEERKDVTGSLTPSEPVFLAVGKFRRPHGLEGETIMEVYTDFPERLRNGKEIYVGAEYTVYHLKSTRQHGNMLLVTLEEIQSVEDAGKLRNLMVFTKTNTLPTLGKGNYYFHQLMNLTVIDENGQTLGQLSEILETNANNVYVVKTPQGEEILLPAIDAVILDIDLENKVMRVRPPVWWERS